MRWPWRRRRPNGEAARSKAEATGILRAEQHFTRYIERAAGEMDLTDEEFAARVARAFRRRPA